MTTIVKASGEKAQFDRAKLRRSLMRVGADPALIDEIVSTVEGELNDGMTTRNIYRIAFRLLNRRSRTLAAKFHLKRAILKLGTSGFPFEKYFAELLKNQNMVAVTNQIISGRCINHEVDIVAKNKDKTIFVECKYHNTQGIKVDLKVSLYAKARFEDLREGITSKRASVKILGWLVTNTRFSSDALKYGICAGVHLVGWDFPKDGSLKEIIESTGLYPVTCITSLNQSEISQLLANKIVLCRDIMRQPVLLDRLKIPPERKLSILSQCEQLCFEDRLKELRNL